MCAHVTVAGYNWGSVESTNVFEFVGHNFPDCLSDSPVSSEFKVLVVEDISNGFEMLKRSLRRTRLFDLTWKRSALEGLTELGNLAVAHTELSNSLSSVSEDG